MKISTIQILCLALAFAVASAQELSCVGALMNSLSDGKIATIVGSTGKGVNDLGDYDQCRLAEGLKYGVLNFRVNGLMPVFIGMCLPKDCKSADFAPLSAAIESLGKGAISTPYVEFTEDVPSKMSAWRIVGIIFYSLFACMLVFGLVVEYTTLFNKRSINEDPKADPAHNKTVLGKACIAFSPSRNIKKLFYSPFNEKDNLKVLNGVRFFSMLYVILGHAYFNVLISPVTNIGYMNTLVQPLWFQIIPGGFFAVDVFFFLSAFLGAYLMILKFERSRKMNFFMIFFHRFYRLAPNVLLIMFFMSTFYPLISSGPMWNYYSDFWTRDCSKYFWSFATFINSIYPGQNVQCLGWLWYLSHDFLFFVALTFQVFAFIHNKIIGYAFAWILLIFNLAFVSATVAYYDISSSILLDANYGDKIYFKPWSRLGSYQVGVLMGMLYYEYIKGDKEEGDKTKLGYKFFKSVSLSRTLRYILYGVGFIMIVSMVFAITPETRLFTIMDENGVQKRFFPTWFNAIYVTLCRPIYVGGLGLILAGPLTGKGSFLQSFLGGRIYAPWVKFSFYGYMVHLFVFTYYSASLRANIYLNHGTILMIYIGVIVTTLLIAVVLSTAFESPLMQIERLILFPPKKKVKKQVEESEDVRKGDPRINDSTMMSSSPTSDQSRSLISKK